MKKIYYLKTCSTCQRIIKTLNLSKDFTQQDLKTTPISASDLEVLKSLSGSFEALFSKRAKLYKEMELKNKMLQEADYRKYILDHYTFLKRPVLVIEDQIFVGNSPKTITAAKFALTNA
ncbi:MAG: hypothetical protein CMP78_05955 [Formosa sp.]|jgi:arsenate reductase|nr:hypothetical protein [Formosa sp.]|tara:strand:+ start:24871 stop:25227 length:357 start_codon:yes stop_codon:yes gene_type:complete